MHVLLTANGRRVFIDRDGTVRDSTSRPLPSQEERDQTYREIRDELERPAHRQPDECIDRKAQKENAAK